MIKLCGNCKHCSHTGTYCNSKDKEVDWDDFCKTWQKDYGDKSDFVKQAIAVKTENANQPDSKEKS